MLRQCFRHRNANLPAQVNEIKEWIDLLSNSASERERNIALVCILLAVLFWGFSFISTKIVLDQIPPVSIAFFRQFIAAATLIPILVYTRSIPAISLRDLGIITASSFFGIVMYSIFENNGLMLTTASNASMIVSALPIFTMFAETLIFKMRITWKMIGCLAVSFIGVALLVTVNGRIDLLSGQLLGNLMVMGAMACWVVYNILILGLGGSHSSIATIAYQSLISIPLLVPFVIPEAGRWPPISGITSGTVINMAFLGVFCSGVAYLCYIRAVRKIGATVASAFLNLIPVVTVICGYILLGEMLTLVQVAGMVLVMAALYELNRVTGRAA